MAWYNPFSWGDEEGNEEETAQKYRDLGKRVSDEYRAGQERGSQRYGELTDLYKKQWQSQQERLGRPTRLGELYSQRQGGYDPYSKYMMDAMAKSNADQFAARGMLSSGASLEALAKGQAQFAAEQAQQMGQLAGAADQQELARMGMEQEGFRGLQGLYGQQNEWEQSMMDRYLSATSDAEKNAILAE